MTRTHAPSIVPLPCSALRPKLIAKTPTCEAGATGTKHAKSKACIYETSVKKKKPCCKKQTSKTTGNIETRLRSARTRSLRRHKQDHTVIRGKHPTRTTKGERYTTSDRPELERQCKESSRGLRWGLAASPSRSVIEEANGIGTSNRMPFSHGNLTLRLGNVGVSTLDALVSAILWAEVRALLSANV